MIHSLLLFLLLIPPFSAIPSTECFSCVSNPNWSFYHNRIQGLLPLNNSTRPPIAPLTCLFDPYRIYADRTAVACNSKCVKFIVSTIRSDGGVEASILRGCFDKLVDRTIHSEPAEGRCYQSPPDYNHNVDIDYSTTCFCSGFLCNPSHSSFFSPLLLPFILSRIH